MINVEYKTQPTPKETPDYPWIGIKSATDDKGLVVLFTEYNQGFILRSPGCPIGTPIRFITIEGFVPLKSPITLRNA